MPVALLLAASISGCKDDPPAPKPEPASSSAANVKGKLNLRNQMVPGPKIDPKSMKDYRIDACYFGTLTLKQARDAYLASLGKDEPSEKKIPNFGAAAAPPTPPTPPGQPPGATKPPDAKDPTKPTKPGDPAMARPRQDERKPFNFAMRAPHERNARACTVAANLKEPALPDADAALAAFAPYAVELAKDVAAANSYYQREEYKKDSFEKGKELHKKLVAEFAKLDEMYEKLAAGVTVWHKANPPDLAGGDEGQKVALTAYEDARNVMLGLIAKKVDVEAHKAAVKKLGESAAALKTFGTDHQTDAWSKMMAPSLDAFIRAVDEITPKLTDKGIDSESYLPLVTTFSSLIESKNRALTKALSAKAGPTRPVAPPDGHGHEAPAAPEEKPAQE